MNGNAQVIERFYSAFQKLDYTTMQSCYSDDIIFNDPAFGILEGPEAKAMWEMLCKNAKNFSLSFSNIQLLDEEYATCDWVANYTFSKTGRKVTNKIKAHMRLQDGMIIEHTDQFDIWKWSRQALGLPGILLGWSGYLKNKIRHNARKSLEKFMDT
jgi:ketosteroid isomerase-like protein